MPSFWVLQLIRIGPDRAYPLHFTHPQLLLLLPVLPLRNVIRKESVLFCIWALSFEIIKGCGTLSIVIVPISK